MTDTDREILVLLKEIRQLLVPVSACFEEQFAQIRRQQVEGRFVELESLLSAKRRTIFPFLFDSQHLSQYEIAHEAHVSQPTVSRFVNALLQAGLIEQTRDERGTVVYEDVHGLVARMEAADEQR